MHRHGLDDGHYKRPFFSGVGCVEIYDVGVAGLWRLLERIDEIRAFPVVIAVAGMDAALPSVLEFTQSWYHTSLLHV